MERGVDLEITSQILAKLNSKQKKTLKSILNYRSEDLIFDEIKDLIESIGGIIKLDRSRGTWRIALSLNGTDKMKILMTPSSRYIAEEEFVKDLRHMLEDFGIEISFLS